MFFFISPLPCLSRLLRLALPVTAGDDAVNVKRGFPGPDTLQRGPGFAVLLSGSDGNKDTPCKLGLSGCRAGKVATVRPEITY